VQALSLVPQLTQVLPLQIWPVPHWLFEVQFPWIQVPFDVWQM
jgi:hypothetical protein